MHSWNASVASLLVALFPFSYKHSVPLTMYIVLHVYLYARFCPSSGTSCPSTPFLSFSFSLSCHRPLPSLGKSVELFFVCWASLLYRCCPSTIASWEPTGERVTTLAPNRSLVHESLSSFAPNRTHASLIHNSKRANRTKLFGINIPAPLRRKTVARSASASNKWSSASAVISSRERYFFRQWSLRETLISRGDDKGEEIVRACECYDIFKGWFISDDW